MSLKSKEIISKIYIKLKKHKILILCLSILFIIILIYILINQDRKFYFDKFETYVYKDIKKNLLKAKCSVMWDNQREFINGIIRKYRPKKILELGVLSGGSSIIILNAIKDIENSHLYSIDVMNTPDIGSCVKNSFSYLTNKWTLYKGNIAAKYIEKIGNNIDLAMIDTAHFEPGEILDFLLILPFLKEEAVVIFHDIDHQITHSKGKNMRYYWAPYIIFNLVRGKKFLPSGSGILNKDVGAIILEKAQKRFVYDYCRALGGHWEYMLSDEHIKLVKKFFKKYYDKECLIIFEEALKFNRDFVRDNPLKNFYDRFRAKDNDGTVIEINSETKKI